MNITDRQISIILAVLVLALGYLVRRDVNSIRKSIDEQNEKLRLVENYQSQDKKRANELQKEKNVLENKKESEVGENKA